MESPKEETDRGEWRRTRVSGSAREHCSERDLNDVRSTDQSIDALVRNRLTKHTPDLANYFLFFFCCSV